MKILHKYFIIYLLIIISSYFNCFSEQRPAKDVPQNNYNSLTKFYFKKFDSLNDSEKVKKVVNEVVNFVYEGESKFVLYFFKSLYERALQEKNYYFAAQSEISTGFVYGFLGNHQESEKHLKNALELIENDESINTKILSATIFLNLGAVYLELSEIDRALSYLQKCLSLSIKYKLADIENLANLNISTILMDRQQYSRALIYLTKALDYSRKTKNNNNQAGILYSLGVLYSETKQLQKAIDAAEESLKLFTEMNNKIQIGRIQSFKSSLLAMNGDTLGAIKLIKESIAISEEMGDSLGTAIGQQKLAFLHISVGHYLSAIASSEKSLNYFRKTGDINYITLNLYTLAEAYSKLGDYKKAFQLASEYIYHKEELEKKGINDLISQYEINIADERNQQKMKLLKKENENKLQRQSTFLWGFIVLSIVSILIIIGVFYLYKLKQKTNRKLVEINTTKDKFFTIISHDLKTPIASLKNLSELLSEYYDDFDDKEKIQHLITLKDSSSNVLKLLENLLIWSRLQTNKVPYNPENIDLNKLIESEIEYLKASSNSKNIRIILQMNSNQIAFADEYMIRTVIRNLISNAIKFTPVYGTIQISSSLDKEFLEINVSDTGIGIKEEDKEKIFRLDVKHSTLGTAREQGTGLGLNLCKEFIERHNGKIWFKSKNGTGTVFSFTIPVNN